MLIRVFSLIVTLCNVALADLPTTIKLGLLPCLDGGCAEPGQGLLRGAQLAVEDINNSGGILGKKLELLIESSQEDRGPSYVISAYKKLRELNNVHLFLGPTWTPGGLSLAPIVAKDPSVIIISPTLGARAFSKTATNIFNSRGVDELASKAIAREAYQDGIRNIAIFSSQQPWDQEQGQIFQQEFEKLGGKVLRRVEPTPSETDLRVEALKVVATKPEAIFFSCYAQLPIASLEIGKLKFKGRKYAALIDNLILEASQNNLEGSKYFSFDLPERNFVKRLDAKFGNTGLIYAAIAYDSVQLIAQAIKHANGLEVYAMKDFLSKTTYEGVSGRVHFDADRVAERRVVRWQVVDRKIQKD